MPHKIIDTCIACGACESECPVQAISSGDPIYVIDTQKCDDCATCVSICPVNAIEKA
jgi:ferredoxin